MKKETISAVVMAFNEAESLEASVREINSTLTALNQPYEILIIDDGSSDGTAAIADRLSTTLSGVRVIHHRINAGLGGVYRTGFAEARGDLITFFPADGQFPATIIKEFFPLMATEDMVLGYLPNRKGSFFANGLSMAEKALFRLLFGRLPRFQGVMMFRRSLLDNFELKSKGKAWTVLMELIIRTYRGGFRITCVPTEVRPRTAGRSKVNNLSTIWANLKQAVLLKAIVSIQRTR